MNEVFDFTEELADELGFEYKYTFNHHTATIDVYSDETLVVSVSEDSYEISVSSWDLPYIDTFDRYESVVEAEQAVRKSMEKFAEKLEA